MSGRRCSMAETAKRVQVVEVGPRDGLQNLPDYLPAAEKLRLIDGLIDAGVAHLQITSFVSPKAIPQMRDAEEIARTCLERHPQLDLFALVPNLRGAQTAHRLGMKKVANVISLSESHNKANINRTRAQSLEEVTRIRDSLPELEVCVDVATAFGCPFEGRPTQQALVDFVGQVRDLGVRTFCLCDTIGVADPAQVRGVLKAVKAAFPDSLFQVHIHDTRNMGMVNTLAALECGADGVQSTLGGLGGCPFAPDASGNTATEDLVYMLGQMGYDTGIDFTKLLALAKTFHSAVPGNYSGHHIHIRSAAPCPLPGSSSVPGCQSSVS